MNDPNAEPRATARTPDDDLPLWIPHLLISRTHLLLDLCGSVVAFSESESVIPGWEHKLYCQLQCNLFF